MARAISICTKRGAASSGAACPIERDRQVEMRRAGYGFRFGRRLEARHRLLELELAVGLQRLAEETPGLLTRYRPFVHQLRRVEDRRRPELELARRRQLDV